MSAPPVVPPGILPLILSAATRHGIPGSLLVAMAAKESSFDPEAWNPEPRYRFLWDVSKRKPFRKLTAEENASEVPPSDFTKLGGPLDQEWWGQQASWGLIQCMGAVAREYGFNGVYFTHLCRPEEGLEYGGRLMERLLARYDEADALSSYNAGHPTPDNYDAYVRPIQLWAAGYKAQGF